MRARVLAAATVLALVLGLWIGLRRSTAPPVAGVVPTTGAETQVATRAVPARPRLPPPLVTTVSDLAPIDPESAGYDPVALGFAGRRGPELWAVEPRDEAWAAAMEAGLTPLVSRDLAAVVPGIEDIEIECRTTMCQVSWSPEGMDSGKVWRIHKLLLKVYIGALFSRGPNGEVLLAYAGGAPGWAEMRGKAKEALAQVTANRQRRLERLRTGKTPAILAGGIPAEEWPAP